MASRRTTQRTGAIALGAALAVTGLTGCGDDDDDEARAYCVRADSLNAKEGRVADSADCERTPRAHFIWLLAGRSSYRLDDVVKKPLKAVAYDDVDGRKKLGLPATGAVANGATRSSGFGSTASKGGSGSKGGGGFGGSGGGKGGGSS